MMYLTCGREVVMQSQLLVPGESAVLQFDIEMALGIKV
jgi:hypothetical protein